MLVPQVMYEDHATGAWRPVRELCDEPWERTDAVSMVHEVKPRGLTNPSPNP